MIVEVLCGAPVAAAAIGYTARRWRLGRAEAQFIGRVRAMQFAPALYQKVERGELWRLAALERIEDYERGLRELGYRTIGPLISPRSIPGGRNIARVMVGPDRLAYARLTVLTMTEMITIVSVGANGDEVVTMLRGLERTIAKPPHVDLEARPPSCPLPELVALHRERAATLVDPVLFGDLDDVLRCHVTTRAREVAWRTSQDPEAALEADLRALLGHKFERFGKALMRRMRAPVPRAVARRGA